MIWEEYWKTYNRLECGRSGQDPPMESVVPGGYRQLFIDNVVIEHMDNLKKTLHQPERDPGNPVIKPDCPWEDEVGYTNVIYDEEEACFKAWYGARSGIAYAVSQDGLHWDKPLLGLIEIDGNTENNLVIHPLRSGTIIKDPYDEDPARRYKYFGLKTQPLFGLYTGFSPDGLRWTDCEDPVLTPDNDPGLNDHPTMMHDRLCRRYIAFPKSERNNPFANGDWGMMQRMRCVSLSQDFERWSDPVLTLRADDQDPPDLQIHGMSGFNYENIYLGFVDIMHSGDVGPMERTMDMQLALSRDGEVWWRAGNRETILTLGSEGAFDEFMIVPAHTPPIRVGEELYIYYSACGFRHRQGAYPEHRRREPWCGPGHPELRVEGKTTRFIPKDPSTVLHTGMGLARLRVDGFVSVDAGPRPGRLLTRPLLFQGNALHVNADATRGYVRAELFRAQPVDLGANRWTNSPAWNWTIDQPIPGYTLNDCLGIEADTTDGIMRWKGGAGIESFADEMIVIRFQLCNASLYSFWLA